jgi:hypothetical protein
MPSLVRNTGVGGSTANVTGLNSSTGLTVALWCKLSGGASTSTDVIRHASTANAARSGFRIGFSAADFRLDILGATGSNNYAAVTGVHRNGRWNHFAATHDNATNTLLGYWNGNLTQRTNATQDITADAACTTIWNPAVIGSGSGFLFFDLQILPNVVVPPSDVKLLMNPRYSYPNVKGRYFGINFRTTAAGTNALLDESGSGNNLTISPSAFQQGEEPPYLPTYQ